MRVTRTLLSLYRQEQKEGLRRVVVTGTGLLSCLGVGTNYTWERILKGHSGISKLISNEYTKIPCKVAGIIPVGEGVGELDINRHITKSEQRGMNLGTCYALIAAEEAINQARWKPTEEEKLNYTGVAVGTGMAGMEEIAETGSAFREKGYNKVSPFFLLKVLTNMPAGQISIRHGFKGPNHAVSTACTTGVHAIGDAYRFIKYGDAHVMICGGTEASVTPLPMASFSRIRALSTGFNDRPTEASRPFDVDRDGFVMGEGAGILVIEELEHARSRGADILGEILGYGLSGDANHITAPSETGDGALRCMQAALADAGLSPKDLGYINAHATSTPLGDAAESKAITKLLGDHRFSVGVSSTKGAFGHLLGAAGCAEAICTLLACAHGTLPPTANCYNPDPEFDLNYVPLEAQKWETERRRIALTNSFGFGGTNASLCVASFVD